MVIKADKAEKKDCLFTKTGDILLRQSKVNALGFEIEYLCSPNLYDCLYLKKVDIIDPLNIEVLS